MNRSALPRSLTFFVLFLSLLGTIFLFGCGGGTEGTGGITIDGSVRDNKQQPLSGVPVTLLSTGETVLSDVQGNFSLYSVLQPSYQLSFNYEGREPVATLSDVPATASHIQVVFHLDGNEPVTVGPVTVTHQSSSSNGENDHNSTPTPNPSYEPSNTPSATPTETPSSDDGSEDQGNGGNGNSASPTPSISPHPTETPEPSGKVTQVGPISLLTSNSIVVNAVAFVVNRDTEFKDAQGRELPASQFQIGTPVTVRGEYDGGKLLAKLVKKSS